MYHQHTLQGGTKYFTPKQYTRYTVQCPRPTTTYGCVRLQTSTDNQSCTPYIVGWSIHPNRLSVLPVLNGAHVTVFTLNGTRTHGDTIFYWKWFRWSSSLSLRVDLSLHQNPIRVVRRPCTRDGRLQLVYVVPNSYDCFAFLEAWREVISVSGAGCQACLIPVDNGWWALALDIWKEYSTIGWYVMLNVCYHYPTGL